MGGGCGQGIFVCIKTPNMLACRLPATRAGEEAGGDGCSQEASSIANVRAANASPSFPGSAGKGSISRPVLASVGPGACERADCDGQVGGRDEGGGSGRSGGRGRGRSAVRDGVSGQSRLLPPLGCDGGPTGQGAGWYLAGCCARRIRSTYTAATTSIYLGRGETGTSKHAGTALQKYP